MLLVAAASMPLQLEVRARVAHAESRTLELTLDHPLSTDLMRTHARLGAAGGSCRVVPVVSDGSVSHSVRVTLVEPCALTVGAPATLTLETTFARLLLAHGAVRS
jgi:hypothetical protein